MSKLTPPTDNDRLHIFESVQFDPELWSLVQQKYNRFEDLHHQIADLQGQRANLITQLSQVNESISKLQQQLVILSGHEADDDGKEQAEAAAQEEAPQAPLADEPLLDGKWSALPETKPFEVKPQSEPDEDEDDNQETVVGLKPLEFEGVDDDNAGPADESNDARVEPLNEEKVDIEPYVPAAVSEPTTAPAEPEPVAPVAEAAAPVVEPAAQSDQAPAVESGPVPPEVAELQKLFDEADDQRRQSDSALKLVQLYDGKAETFFAAMCRSHQQSGLSDDDARKEAVKDVQTMIATAKHNTSAPEPKKTDDQSKPNGKSGGMRRLFGHS